MSQNFHTDIPFKAPVNSAVVNSPLGTLDQGITDLDTRMDTLENMRAGAAAFTQANFGSTTTLTISSGVITVSQTYHKVDTEAAAASDNLDTINGVAGDFLLLACVSAARVVTVRHNVGNVYFGDGNDRVLNDTNRLLLLVYNGAKWVEHLPPDAAIKSREVISSTLVNTQQILWPDRALINPSAGQVRPAVLPNLGASKLVLLQAMGASGWVHNVGHVIPTLTGTPASALDSDGHWIEFTTGVTINTDRGLEMTTFNYFSRQLNPLANWVIKTPSDLTSYRLFMVLTAASFAPSTDTPLGGGSGLIGFRYSTAAGDGGWVGYSSDGVSTSVTATVAAIATSTRYLLRIRVDESVPAVYFSVNNGTEVSLTTNLPAAGQALGYLLAFRNLVGADRRLRFGRLEIAYK